MKLGIGSRFALIFSLLVLLATGTEGYMVYQAARQSLIDSSTERLNYTARTAEVRLAASVESITKDARFLASTPPVMGIVRARSRRGLDPETALLDWEWRDQLSDIFAAFLADRPNLHRLRFVAAYDEGKELVRVERRDGNIERISGKRLMKQSGTPLYQEAFGLQPGSVYVSDLRTEAIDGDVIGAGVPKLESVAPVFDEQGKHFGYIEISIDFSEALYAAVAVVDPDKTMYLFDEQGKLLVGSVSMIPEGSRQDSVRVLTSRIDGFAALVEGRLQNIRIESVASSPGNPLTAFFERVPLTGDPARNVLIVGVTSPHALILDGVRRVRDKSVLITLLFCLGGIILAMGFSGFMTRPLSQVTQALSDFGKEDWIKNLPIRRRDEIGVLARTFKKMAAQIHSQVAELEEKEKRQRIILETSADGIIVTDSEGYIETFNRAAERIFGYSSEEITGKRFSELLHGTEEGDGEEALLASIGQGYEMFGRKADGEVFSLLIAASSFLLGGERKYAAFVQDITERKRYEVALQRAKEQAEEMAHLKTAFLANMSHEIRTPLTSVIGYASLLSKEVDDKHRRFAMLIERSGRRLMDTLNSVLSLAQLEAGRVQVQLSEIDVGHEIEEIVQLYEQLATEKNLTLSYQVAPEAQEVRACLDKGALSSILQNLIGNAVKFTQRGGIHVSVDTMDAFVRVHVADTGVGIDAPFLPHLFDEFSQESSGLSRSHEGSGLGLAITRRLVELMGGTISVRSKKDQGSTFTVSFPIFMDEPTARRTGETEGSVGSSDTMPSHMLLVEDNPETAFLILHLLLDVCDVTIATSAEEALRKASARRFDAVLLDINLGQGGNGLDLIGRLRALPHYDDTPIAAVTAYALPGDRERFLAAGFDRYLSKPFTTDGLLEMTARLIRSDSPDPSIAS